MADLRLAVEDVVRWNHILFDALQNVLPLGCRSLVQRRLGISLLEIDLD